MDAFYTENIVTEKYGYNMTINIYNDPDAQNPFDEWDTLGTLETFCSPSKFESFLEELTRSKAAFVTGSTQYEDYVIYATRETIFKEYKRKRMSRKLWETVCNCLYSEYNNLEKWLNGEVFGFVIVDMETEENIESCWGFYDFNACLEYAKETALAYRKPVPAWAKNWMLLPGLTAEQIGNPFLRVA